MVDVAEPFTDRLAAAVDYFKYRLLNKPSHYDGDVADELQNMVKKIIIHEIRYSFWKRLIVRSRLSGKNQDTM